MEEIFAYRLRHIPTGLFYQPVKGRWQHQATNLSKRGKVYLTKNYPKMDGRSGRVNVSESLIEEFNIPTFKSSSGYSYLEYKSKDWEIVEYKLVENETKKISNSH